MDFSLLERAKKSGLAKKSVSSKEDAATLFKRLNEHYIAHDLYFTDKYFSILIDPAIDMLDLDLFENPFPETSFMELSSKL